MYRAVHNLTALAVCFCLVPLTGCAQTPDSSPGLFSKFARKKTPEEALHIKTPDDRMKEMKELAKNAKKKTPEEQQRIVDQLAKEIEHESDAALRRQMLRTLTVYPQPTAAKVIVAGLADGDMETRRVACACLGTRGGKEAVQELTRVVSSDTSLDVRVAAVRAMGHTHDSSALAPLVEALADGDPAMQALAHESLAAVSGRDYGGNVQAWREYAATGKSAAPEVSLAERIRRSFD
jgi:HEAT repeat protein